MALVLSICFVAFIGTLDVLAQAPTGDEQFDVVSIKPVVAGTSQARLIETPVQFYRRALSLRNLLSFAYDVRDFQVIGGPDWVSRENYEVSARTSRPMTTDEMRPLVRRLVDTRFAARVREELREMPTYDLVLARGDGRLGNGLRRTDVDCEPVLVDRRRPDAPPRDAIPHCTDSYWMFMGSRRVVQLRGIALSRLVAEVEFNTQRKIVDRTGLTGRFDIDLTYQSPSSLSPSGDAPMVADALVEQLGLRLQSSRGQVRMIVVKAAARPTAN
jgi:uncharacterized protein (TIGR03435 family)